MRAPTAASAKKRAWKAFAAYIRKRDPDCISSEGKTTEAGHWLHTTDKDTNPNLGGNELWYNEKNVNGQCGSCNRHKSGNLAEYAIQLEEKWGDGTIKELYRLRRTPKKWTIEELLAIEAKYRAMI